VGPIEFKGCVSLAVARSAIASDEFLDAGSFREIGTFAHSNNPDDVATTPGMEK